MQQEFAPHAYKSNMVLECPLTPPLEAALYHLKEIGVNPSALYHEFVCILNVMITNAYHHHIDIHMLCEMDAFQFIGGNESLIVKMQKELWANKKAHSRKYPSSNDYNVDEIIFQTQMESTLTLLRGAYNDLMTKVVLGNYPLFEGLIKQHVSINLISVQSTCIYVEVVRYVHANHRSAG